MTRRNKIDLIRGILKGTRSVTELRPTRYAIAYEHPDTGAVTGRSPYAAVDDDARIQRNERLLEQSKSDPSITVIRITYA